MIRRRKGTEQQVSGTFSSFVGQGAWEQVASRPFAFSLFGLPEIIFVRLGQGLVVPSGTDGPTLGQPVPG